MTFVQKLTMALLPKQLAERVKTESQDWMLQCPSCQREISVWEAGGVRYKATNKVKRLGWCSRCGKKMWLRLYRKSSESQSMPAINE